LQKSVRCKTNGKHAVGCSLSYTRLDIWISSFWTRSIATPEPFSQASRLNYS